ncbi:hypothetical protein CHS0354_002208 [Potamilus streckersoni]|uniref:THD domain-containing protein n=1 Tax=Potamilus streckersoni TaxID=2493646 RepID=A0AAE0RS05_9BIVA|nr:hypothetical protein CHS0354_002208 [Potamilus streckersoni]
MAQTYSNCCKDSRAELLAVKRVNIFLTAVSCMACFVSIVMCVFTAHLYFKLVNISDIHTHAQTKVTVNSPSNIQEEPSVDIPEDGYEAPLLDSSDAKLDTIIKRSVRNKAPKLKGEKRDKKPGKRRHCPKPQHNETIIAAAHYTTYMTDDFVRQRFGPINLTNPNFCQGFPEWRGTACRTRIFQSPEPRLVLNTFKAADWMRQSDVDSGLFEKLDNGTFIAKRSGLYLLYAQVLLYDVQRRQAVGIIHKKEGYTVNSMRCMESVDYNDPNLDVSVNSKYKSCSVTGVLYINQGEAVEVQLLYPNTQIDLTEDATYFGGILFAKKGH